MTGVSFDGIHSYREWGLKLKSRFLLTSRE